MTLKTTIAATVLLAPLLSVFHSTEARAQTVPNGFVWRSVPGCASAIGVGADNDPWILDCGNWGTPGLHRVYHQSRTCDPLCRSTWADGGTLAYTLAVDLNGDPYVTTGPGQVFANVLDANAILNVPTQNWAAVTNGCVESFAVEAMHESPEIVMGQTFTTQGMSILKNIWGIGCSGQGFLSGAPPVIGPIPNVTDQAMFVNPINLIGFAWNGCPETSGSGSTVQCLASQWEQVGAWAANAALDLAMFTQVTGTGPTDFVQTPWARNAEGGVFHYSVLPQGSAFVSSGGLATSNITSLTDHYAMLGHTMLLYWTGTAGGQGGFWQIIAGGSGAAAPIKQIAYSSAMPGTSQGTVGPSNLWAIDTLGNIYFAAAPTPPAK